jgi:hypothetical protein
MPERKVHPQHENVDPNGPLTTPLSEAEYKWVLETSGGTENQRFWIVTQDKSLLIVQVAYVNVGYVVLLC